MSGRAAVRPLSLPSTPGACTPRRGGATSAPDRTLPLAAAPERRATGRVYGMSVMDGRGRIADIMVVRALGWTPQTRLGMRERGGLLIIGADADGVFRLTGEGHLRLLAAVRRWCGIHSGDRLLLVAEPELGRLVVHPPAALDAIVTAHHDVVIGGEAR